MITTKILKAVMPRLSATKAEAYLPYLNAAMEEFGINTRLRISAFLSQLAAESGEFKWFEEIASGAAYEGRKDLGNTKSGDGKRYKGRGPIQLTGRANYRAAGQDLGLDLEGTPEMASSPEVGFRTAGWFWKKNNINKFADKGDIRAVTLMVNAGRSTGRMPERAHFPVRQEYYNKALKVLENYDNAEPEVKSKLSEPEVFMKPMEEKPLATGYVAEKDVVEGTPPPAPAAEVKASQPSLLTKISSLTIPAGAMAILTAIGNFFMTLPPWVFVVIVVVAILIGFFIWRDSQQRAHERTLKVMDAAASKEKNNLRLV